MKRVLEWRDAPADPNKAHIHEYWLEDWRFRFVECAECGNWWWEGVKPRRYATTGTECC